MAVGYLVHAVGNDLGIHRGSRTDRLCDFDRSLFDADRTSGLLSPTESFFVGACPAAGKARSQFPYDVSADVFGYFLGCFGHKQRARFRADPAVAAGIKTI